MSLRDIKNMLTTFLVLSAATYATNVAIICVFRRSRPPFALPAMYTMKAVFALFTNRRSRIKQGFSVAKPPRNRVAFLPLAAKKHERLLVALANDSFIVYRCRRRKPMPVMLDRFGETCEWLHRFAYLDDYYYINRAQQHRGAMLQAA